MAQQNRQFETFSIDTDRGVVSRDGDETRLRRQSFDVLMYLVDRPGTLVTKDELVSAIWGGTAVTDNSLTQCMAEIRKALGDGDHRIVRTVVRRGYRFQPPVAPHSGDEKTKPARNQIATVSVALALGAAVVAVLVTMVRDDDAGAPADKPVETHTAVTLREDLSIAVLEFDNLGGGDKEQLFIDSFREEIGRQLSHVDRLRVVSPLSIDRANRDDISMQVLGETLDADYVLRGSVRRANDTLRLRVQLFDAEGDELYWEKSQDIGASTGAYFDAENAIAAKLASRIGVRILPDFYLEKSEHAPVNVEALNHFYNGLYHLRKCEYEGLGPGAINVHLAIGRFEESIAADSNWAPPHFGIARAMRYWSTESHRGEPEFTERLGVASQRLNRALEIDSRYTPALADLARAQIALDRNLAAARQTYERILHLGVKESHWLHARLLKHERRFDEAALEMMNTIEALEAEGKPTLRPRTMLVRAQMCGGRYQDALEGVEEFRSSVSSIGLQGMLVEPEAVDRVEARAYLRLGERRKGLALTNQLADRYGSDLPVASLLALAGQEERARNAMRAIENPSPAELEYLFEAALALGEYELALDYLEASIPYFNPLRRWLYCDGRTDALAGNPRFSRILNEIGVPERATPARK